ncbi:MAG: hypothetical protein R3B72_26020 [Polyangiaceae bacterium]
MPRQRQLAGRWLLLGTWLLAGALGIAGPLLVTACADDGVEPPPAAECGPRPVVDAPLLAFLSKAKAVHHQADLAEADKDIAGAEAALRQLVDGPVPGGAELPPEAREVLADTLARLAELGSSEGRFDAAVKDVERGLALARERTHFRGRLMEVLGVVEQRRYEHLLADGEDVAAKAAKERAIKAFQEAIAIQDEVIERALGDLDGDAPGR